jgi:hypothetical protein
MLFELRWFVRSMHAAATDNERHAHGRPISSLHARS